jgi:hypothetical protein
MPTARVMVAEAGSFKNYRALRDALGHLLMHRLPEVPILTGSGAGGATDPHTLSYALARRLDVVQYWADHQKHPLLFDADAARNGELVRDADAAVLVWDEFDGLLRDLLVRCEAKGIPVRVLGAGGGPSEPRPERPTRRGLPDRGPFGDGWGQRPASADDLRMPGPDVPRSLTDGPDPVPWRRGRPDVVVDVADDGTPLTDLRGWTCASCDRLFANPDAAEWCCVGPDAVVVAPRPRP